eukprot:6473152-Prymnesium_polylepis.1
MWGHVGSHGVTWRGGGAACARTRTWRMARGAWAHGHVAHGHTGTWAPSAWRVGTWVAHGGWGRAGGSQRVREVGLLAREDHLVEQHRRVVLRAAAHVGPQHEALHLGQHDRLHRWMGEHQLPEQ